jgi:hypothetical protein
VSDTLETVRRLVASGEVRISEHGYDELASDNISVREIMSGVASAVVVEDYPAFGKGPAVLVLQSDATNQPIHVVWGIPKGHRKPAVLVTAYRPDPRKWRSGFLERRK